MNFSFDIKNSKDLFNELCTRAREYHKKPLSSGNAVICAILSWHIVEWIYQEFSSMLVHYPTKAIFRDSLKQECPSLGYMQDIANGSKHRGISHYTPTVRYTKVQKGGLSTGFSKGFDVPCLKMEIEQNQIVYFDEELSKVEAYLNNFFLNVLEINT